MMYKDKDKQREANRERQRRYKEKQKALLNEGVTDKALPTGYDRTAAGNLTEEGIRQYRKIGYKSSNELSVNTPRRGKDIKCFEDLPPDVQETINQMCRIDDNKIDATAKANRTAIAINYQHLYPDRYHSTGVICSGPVVTGKPGSEGFRGHCIEARRRARGR
jgi:hypothetical protein